MEFLTPHTIAGAGKIWIDLDNSPHVPFFAPIIEELEQRGYEVFVTARRCFQVCELANLWKLRYKRIGRHYGKSRILKAAGLCVRALELAPTVIREAPLLAISHGSRSQLLLSALMRIPSLVIVDYEFARGLVLMRPSWVMVPEPIPSAAIPCDSSRVLKYPGIKEDVYASRFRPDSDIRDELGISTDDVLVTIRPPANEAHYHNPESDSLFRAAIEFVSTKAGTKIVLLPRNASQEASLREAWPHLFESGRVIVPPRAVDGLNLIWYSDLVISGGGTMNREAAALGVPVYSIFKGRIGAVDRYLSNAGRLVLVETAAAVRTKIQLVRRFRPAEPPGWNCGALSTIINHVVGIVESLCPIPRHQVQ